MHSTHPQITQESCDQACVPTKKTLGAASFTNSGGNITVSLSAPAQSISDTPCSYIFDSTTSSKLGSASCSTSGPRVRLA